MRTRGCSGAAGIGAQKSNSYEGDGSITVRDQSTEVVKKMLNTIIGTARVCYAD